MQAAAMYATVIIGMPTSIEEGRAQRETVRQAAAQASQDPEEIKYLALAGFTIGDTDREALKDRSTLDAHTDIRGPLARPSAYLGLQQQLTQPDEPLTTAQLAAIQPHPQDARQIGAVELAYADGNPATSSPTPCSTPTPAIVGTAEQVADHLQEWFEADAADSFMLHIDDFSIEIGNFVDQVVPTYANAASSTTPTKVKTPPRPRGTATAYGLNTRHTTGA